MVNEDKKTKLKEYNRSYYLKNREKIIQRAKTRQIILDGQPTSDERLEYCREYYAKHRELIRANQRAYYQKHKDRIKLNRIRNEATDI